MIGTRVGGLVAAALLAGAPASTRAEPARSGAQVEAFAGGSACIDGSAGCSRDAPPITGRTQPSFGGGLAVGGRPRPWIFLAALYRVGLFDPDYQGVEGDHIVQHTIAFAVRPILPVWRFDLGLNLGVGYSRQAVDFRESGRRDFTQGATFIAGITIDTFVTDHIFAGVGADMLLNLHGTMCRRTQFVTDCARVVEGIAFTPNHQVLFGFRIGTTFG
jgi:hypothetical protein